VRLHYVIGGKGSAVVLLHGYAETAHMWAPIMPLLPVTSARLGVAVMASAVQRHRV